MKKIILFLFLTISFAKAGDVVANGKLYGDFVELTYATNTDVYVVEYIQIENIISFAKYLSKDKFTEEYMIMTNGYYSTEYLIRYIIPKNLFDQLLEKSRIFQNKEFEKVEKHILKSTNP